MAVGAEKVKDSGYQGLNAFPIPNDGTARSLTLYTPPAGGDRVYASYYRTR